MPPHVTIRLTINEAKALDELLEQSLEHVIDRKLFQSAASVQMKAAMRAVDKINEALVAKQRNMT